MVGLASEACSGVFPLQFFFFFLLNARFFAREHGSLAH